MIDVGTCSVIYDACVEDKTLCMACKTHSTLCDYVMFLKKHTSLALSVLNFMHAKVSAFDVLSNAMPNR